MIGLVHFEIPVTVLALIGAIRNVGLHIEEAAQSLGASKARCFLAITLPLSMPGIVAGGVLAFTSAVSAFTIPAFLGKGIVNMASNLIYDRFSDVFDFPEGSALAMILLVWSIALSFGLSIFLVRVVRRRSS